MPAPLPPHGGHESVPDEVEDSAGERCSKDSSDYAESEYKPEESSKPILFFQKRLNNLIRNLSLQRKVRTTCIKIKRKQLAWEKCSNKSLQKVKLGPGRSMHCRRTFCYCHNINDLFQKLGEARMVDEWQLFIDSSKRSLKTIVAQRKYKTVYAYSTFCSSERIL